MATSIGGQNPADMYSSGIGGQNPASITGPISQTAQNAYDYWQNALQNGNFTAPYKQTPDASQYFQPAQAGEGDFLATQAKALGGLVGSPGGGLNPTAMEQRNAQNYGMAQNKAQNQMGMGDLFTNTGIEQKNMGQNFGIGQEVGGTQQAFNQTQQTAGINAAMEAYQQQLKEKQEQDAINSQTMAELFGAGGNLAGAGVGALMTPGATTVAPAPDFGINSANYPLLMGQQTQQPEFNLMTGQQNTGLNLGGY